MLERVKDAVVTDRYAIYLADCMDVLPQIEEASVDAVVTDPPYSSGGAFRGDRTRNTVDKYVRASTQGRRVEFGGDTRDQRGFFAWCNLWMSLARPATSPGGVMTTFSDWRQLPVMTDCVQSSGWVWRNLATWWKPGCRMQRGRFSSSAEYVVYATNGAHSSDGEQSPQNVFSCAAVPSADKLHIAEKPLEVMDWVLGLSRPGGRVLDPFMGSGSTGVAAIRRGMKFVGIEADPAAFAGAATRLAEEAGNVSLYTHLEAPPCLN